MLKKPIMFLVYCLLEGSLLVSPLVAYLLCRLIEPNRLLKPLTVIALIGLVHNLFYVYGLSLRGDIADYIVFAVEYFAFCGLVFAAFRLHRKANYIMIFAALGLIPIACGVCKSIPGSLVFLMMVQDSICDRTLQVASAHGRYETLRYTFGGATLSATRFNFETYDLFVLPAFERLVDDTTLFDNKTPLRLDSSLLTVTLRHSNSGIQLSFRDEMGTKFEKALR
jgi:hypothetical protein